MSKERIYKDFDLPTNHLPGTQHYVPPKARHADEIERRRRLRAGTLLAEQQVKGMSMGAVMLRQELEPEDRRFVAKVLAVGAINSAWYSFARGAEAEVMRRRLKLPILATGDEERHPDLASLVPVAQQGMSDAVIQAHLLVGAHEMAPKRVPETKQHVGRHAGRTAVALACLAAPDGLERYGEPVSDFDAQNFVRQRGLWALHHSRVLADQLGSYPSMAQLADPDSDLSVYWRRQAPNGALEAYEQALASPLAA